MSVLAACTDNNFSTDPRDTLTFSTSEVQFDTVFTEIGTSTRTFMVYNHNKKPLNINSIYLACAEKSGFHINVDGVSGSLFSNVEIGAGDSLYVFVMAKVDPSKQDAPLEIRDSVVFFTNGIKQDVKLRAYGQDVEILRGAEVTTDRTLTAAKPYLIYDSLVVAQGVTLTCEAGTRLHFHNRAAMIVYGTVIANGSLEKPVVWRGDRLDKLFPTLPYDYIPGQWGGVRFKAESYNNHLTHLSMRGSSWGMVIDSAAMTAPKLTLLNSKLHNARYDLFTATNATVTATNCELTNTGGNNINLIGGDYTFIHCTLANLYKFHPVAGSVVHLGTTTFRPDYIPLALDCTLLNCIIFGSSEFTEQRDQQESVAYDYLFDHCSLRSRGADDENFINCQWETTPLFIATGDNYLFNYRLTETSPVREIGSLEGALLAPLDMYGISRTDKGAPDLGASQYTPQ